MESYFQYWSFVAASMLFATVGTVMKNTVFTNDNIVKYKLQRPWFGELLWWGKKTMPLHPVLGGLVMSFIPGIPVADIVKNQAATTLYYCFAGLSSTWAFAVIKGLAKDKGLELDFGDATIPPPKV